MSKSELTPEFLESLKAQTESGDVVVIGPKNFRMLIEEIERLRRKVDHYDDFIRGVADNMVKMTKSVQ